MAFGGPSKLTPKVRTDAGSGTCTPAVPTPHANDVRAPSLPAASTGDTCNVWWFDCGFHARSAAPEAFAVSVWLWATPSIHTRYDLTPPEPVMVKVFDAGASVTQSPSVNPADDVIESTDGAEVSTVKLLVATSLTWPLVSVAVTFNVYVVPFTSWPLGQVFEATFPLLTLTVLVVPTWVEPWNTLKSVESDPPSGSVTFALNVGVVDSEYPALLAGSVTTCRSVGLFGLVLYLIVSFGRTD